MQRAGTEAQSSVCPCELEVQPSSTDPNKVDYGCVGSKRQSRGCLDPWGDSENLSRIFTACIQRKYQENTSSLAQPQFLAGFSRRFVCSVCWAQALHGNLVVSPQKRDTGERARSPTQVLHDAKKVCLCELGPGPG